MVKVSNQITLAFLPHGLSSLPPNFAENLLELEMEAELNCSMNSIKALVEQYSVYII